MLNKFSKLLLLIKLLLHILLNFRLSYLIKKIKIENRFKAQIHRIIESIICVGSDKLSSIYNRKIHYKKSHEINCDEIGLVYISDNKIDSLNSNNSIRIKKVGETENLLKFIQDNDHLISFLMMEDDYLVNSQLENSLSSLASRHEFIYFDEVQKNNKGMDQLFYKPDFSESLFEESDYLGPFVLIKKDLLKQVIHKSLSELSVLRITKEVTLMGITPYHHQEIGAKFNDRTKLLKNNKISESYVNQESLVSIIIPTKNQHEVLENCIDSIVNKSSYENYEIIVLSNNSDDEKSIEFLNKENHFKVYQANFEFNWSKLNNLGRKYAKGEFLVFLNNDTEVINHDWIEKILSHLENEDVGSVGALLLYPDDSIQHAGIVLGLGGFADHVYSGCTEKEIENSIYISPYLCRDVIANTGACVAIRSKLFDKVGGFDEKLKITGDLELGVRLFNLGYKNIYEPRVNLYHHESLSRGKAPMKIEEVENTRIALDGMRQKDPFYNSKLSERYRFPIIKGVL